METNNIVTLIRDESELKSMGDFPSVLETVIIEWQAKQRKNNKYFDGYKELAYLLNYHPHSIRSYTDSFEPKFPTVNTLVAICRITGDRRPIEYLNEKVQ